MWRRIRSIQRRRIRRMTPTLLETSSSPRTLASSRLVPCRPPCSVCSCLGAVISSLAGIKIVRAYAVHAVLTPRISSSPYILHLQNINFYLVYIIIINRREMRNINPVDWSSRYIFSSYRDKAWAWHCLEHFLKYLPSHTCVQLGLKALILIRVFSFSVGIQDGDPWLWQTCL